ncbi:MAG: aminoglycoside phosphotransferase family protein [Patescibacteria group bacterium]
MAEGLKTVNYQEIFTPVFKKTGFVPTKTFREGPRFFVVGGDYQGKKAIFKADVEDPEKETRRAFLKLRREAAFLKAVEFDQAPAFYSQGEEQDFFWMLEELVPGEGQEAGEGTFLFKESFFNKKNLQRVLDFLANLHRVGSYNQNPAWIDFKNQFAKRYTLKDYAHLIASNKEYLVGKELMDKVDSFIASRHNLFDGNQTVITHHEFYAPHIFVNGGSLNVIDWENVGWGNPAYDFAELWFRSFNHPGFQKDFWENFRATQKEQEIFDQLFSLEILLQGLGNLKYFSMTQLEDEKKVVEKLNGFTQEAINRVLRADGKF